jgi:hypothetical protein
MVCSFDSLRCAGAIAARPSRAEQIILAEAAIMQRLLVRDQPDPWTRAELEHAIPIDLFDISEALVNLHGAAVIHLTEQLVTVSRAAQRTADLVALF